VARTVAATGAGSPATVEVPITQGWGSGFHVVELRSRPAGAVGDTVRHAGFAVRPPVGAPTAPVLSALSTNTWNAYNHWGGPNQYTGGTHVSFARPFARG
jgi:hypothetical protein